MSRLFSPFVGGRGAVGLLILRLVVGAALMLHGWPKMHSPTSWMGPGAPVPGFLQFLAAFSEFFGGLAFLTGLLTPIAALGVAVTMAVAAFTVGSKGAPFVNPTGSGPSYELSLTYLAAALALMLVGPGRFSLDYALFGRRIETPVAECETVAVR